MQFEAGRNKRKDFKINLIGNYIIISNCWMCVTDIGSISERTNEARHGVVPLIWGNTMRMACAYPWLNARMTSHPDGL